MKRWGNITFLSLTTVAAFFLLIQLLGWLNGAISAEIDRYWLQEGRIGIGIAMSERVKPLSTASLVEVFSPVRGMNPRKGELTHLLDLVERFGPGEPTKPRDILWGLKQLPGLPGRTECFNGWVDALELTWRRKFADTPDTDKNAFQARLGKLFTVAGVEGGKFDALKIAAGETRQEVRRKVEAFRVLALGLNQGGE